MSLVAKLESGAVVTTCKLCFILRDLAERDAEEYNAAMVMLKNWGHVAVADTLTQEGYPVSEKTVRTHRKKGHDNGAR